MCHSAGRSCQPAQPCPVTLGPTQACSSQRSHAQGVDDEAPHDVRVGADGVAAAAEVEQVPAVVTIHHVVGFVVQVPEGQGVGVAVPSCTSPSCSGPSGVLNVHRRGIIIPYPKPQTVQ